MFVFIGIFLDLSNVKAITIEKGTVSMEGWSDIYFMHRDSDYWDSKSFNIDVAASYFVIDNFDVGINTYFTRKNINNIDNSSKRYTFGLGPIVAYHISQNETSNFYICSGIVFRKYNETSFDNTNDGIGYEINAKFGWEYFINPHVAITPSLKLCWVEWRTSDDNTEIRYSLGASVKVFF